MNREDVRWIARFLIAVGLTIMIVSFTLLCLMDALKH